MRKALMGRWGADAKTCLSLFTKIYSAPSPPPLVFYTPRAETYLGGTEKFQFCFLMKIFLPPPPLTKMKSASD